MRVSEIIYSISGEGIHAGIPTVFVRLTGCNLRCSYCDTKYAQNLSDGEDKTAEQIVYDAECLFYPRIPQLRIGLRRWILITGGEPLLRCDDVGYLVCALKCDSYLIEVETNGSIDPPTWFKWVDCWSVDIKCPSSGPSYGSFRECWLRKLRKQDQLKFVVGTEEDLDFVRGFLSDNGCRAQMLVSPVIQFGWHPEDEHGCLVVGDRNRKWLQEVAEFCKEQNVRMSLQLHKVIWGDKKGV